MDEQNFLDMGFSQLSPRLPKARLREGDFDRKGYPPLDPWAPLGAPDLRHAPYRLEGKYLPKALKKLTIEDHIEITVSDGMLAIFAYDYGQVAICKTKARKLIEFLIAKLPELQDEPG
jgi:hypothetical protein